MPRRKLNPVSFRGIGLPTNGRSVHFEYDEGGYNSPRHEAVEIGRQGNFPSFLRQQPDGKTFPLRIIITSSAKQSQFDEISRIFDPTLGEGTLILEDLRCNPAQRYQVECVPEQIIVDKKIDTSMIVPLFAAEPIFIDDTEDVLTDNIDTATPTNPITLTVRNDGTYPSDELALFAIPNLPKLNTQGYLTVIEVAYANRSEFSLTGPGSGTWLINIAPAMWDTAALTPAQIQADGKDIAVFVDEVQVPPEKVTLDGFDTNDTKVWIEISDGPAQFGVLSIAIVAGTTTFVFERADHGLRPGDYLAWDNGSAIEQARVQTVTGNRITVFRSMRNTTAGSSAAGVKVYKSGHHIQLAYNYSTLTAVRPTNPDPPLIDTALSTNLGWDWTTSPMWADKNRRPGGFRRILYNGRDDVPELRKNRLSAKTTLTAFGTTATWQDEEPSVLKPNFDALEFTACCGIDDVIGAIEYDCALDWAFAFQIIGRDLLGYDSVVFNRLGHESSSPHFPPRLYVDQQETPDGILSAVVFRARNIILTSVRASDAMEETLARLNNNGHDLQGFQIDVDAQLLGIVLRARDADDTAGFIEAQINELQSDDPAVSSQLQIPGARIIGPFGGADPVGAAFQPICFFPSAAAAFTTDIPILGRGNYYLSMAATSSTGDFKVPKSDGSIYAKGAHWESDGSGDPDQFSRIADEDLWFAILSLNADNQEETLQQEHSGEFVVLNNMHFTFDPDRTPIVEPAAAENAYYFDTTWAMNGETIQLRWLRRAADMGAADIVQIRPHLQTAIEDKFEDNIRAAVTISGDPWLEALAGDSVLTITAANGAEQERHIVGVRSTWLA